VFVGWRCTIRLQDRPPLKLAHVTTTPSTPRNGISVSSAPTAISSRQPRVSPKVDPAPSPAGKNIEDTVANADSFVAAHRHLGSMDFIRSPTVPRSCARSLERGGRADYDKDFNGTSKAGFTFRRVRGEGDNPGWQLTDDLKTGGLTPPSAEAARNTERKR
jgi:hypothetical protein